MSTIHIRLFDIPETLEPGTPIHCTVDDVPFNASFLRYGQNEDGTEWRRKIWVEIEGLHEEGVGKLSAHAQLDLFTQELPSYVDEFVVNRNKMAVNGYAGMMLQAGDERQEDDDE